MPDYQRAQRPMMPQQQGPPLAQPAPTGQPMGMDQFAAWAASLSPQNPQGMMPTQAPPPVQTPQQYGGMPFQVTNDLNASNTASANTYLPSPEGLVEGLPQKTSAQRYAQRTFNQTGKPQSFFMPQASDYGRPAQPPPMMPQFFGSQGAYQDWRRNLGYADDPSLGSNFNRGSLMNKLLQ